MSASERGAASHRPISWIPVERGEWRPLLWAVLYHFSLFFAYTMLKPLREAFGVRRGVKFYPILFSFTFATMLVLAPCYEFLVARFRRRTFIHIVYHFFSANLLVFAWLMFLDARSETVGFVFFVWLSVFNLFVLTVFWGFMADLFSNAVSRRLFGIIAGGASLGAVCGPVATKQLLAVTGYGGLMLIAIALLQLAVLCVWRLGEWSTVTGSGVERERQSLSGGIFDGWNSVRRNRLLRGIALFLLLTTLIGTIVYNAQGVIVSRNRATDEGRTALFADVDFWRNLTTLVVQLLLTSRILRWLDVGVSLATLPVVNAMLLALLGFYPVALVLVIVQLLRSGIAYGLAKPVKETLFTLLRPIDKYKAKYFIDTIVFRGGDAIAAWLCWFVLSVGEYSVNTLLFLATPLCVLWLAVALWLGRTHRRLRDEQAAPLP